jgi:hypothetical protein
MLPHKVPGQLPATPRVVHLEGRRCCGAPIQVKDATSAAARPVGPLRPRRPVAPKGFCPPPPFNIDEIEGIHTTSSLSGDLDDRIITSFFRRFSELMHQRNYALTIRELEEAMTSVRFLDMKGPMNNLVIPFGIITVDVHGNVYTFSP